MTHSSGATNKAASERGAQPVEATMTSHPHLVLVHSPLVGPYSWAPVAEELRSLGYSLSIPTLTTREEEGRPFWQAHSDAIAEATKGAEAGIVLVAHSGAGQLLPVAGERIEQVRLYVFVDSGIPTTTESRLDGMPEEVAHDFRDAAVDGLLPPWPEEGVMPPIREPHVLQRFLSELAPVPLAIYEEAIPVPAGWPDAPCAYVRLSPSYPDSETHAINKAWPMRRLEGGHFLLLASPAVVANALSDVVRESLMQQGHD